MTRALGLQPQILLCHLADVCGVLNQLRSHEIKAKQPRNAFNSHTRRSPFVHVLVLGPLVQGGLNHCCQQERAG